MIAGERPDPVRTQEFILVEHAGENPAQPVLIHQGNDAAIVHTEVPRAGAMNALEEFRHSLQALLHHGHRLRNPVPLPRFHHGNRAKRQ